LISKVNRYLTFLGVDGFGLFKSSIYISMGLNICGMKMTGQTLVFVKIKHSQYHFFQT